MFQNQVEKEVACVGLGILKGMLNHRSHANGHVEKRWAVLSGTELQQTQMGLWSGCPGSGCVCSHLCLGIPTIGANQISSVSMGMGDSIVGTMKGPMHVMWMI